MAVPVQLARNARRVVTTQDLLDAVWPNTVTADETIYQRIALLRHTLGDDRHQPRYIQTIRKRGYRLVTAVHYTDNHTAAGLDRPPTVRRWWISAIGLILAGGAALTYFGSHQSPDTASLALVSATAMRLFRGSCALSNAAGPR